MESILAIIDDLLHSVNEIKTFDGCEVRSENHDDGLLPDKWYEAKKRIRNTIARLKDWREGNDDVCGVAPATAAAAGEALDLHRTKVSLLKPRRRRELTGHLSGLSDLESTGSAASTPVRRGRVAFDDTATSKASKEAKRKKKRRARSRRSLSEPRIHDFEILKPVSRGAYGRVYLASKRRTGDVFAIKVLEKKRDCSKEPVDRRMAERNVLAKADCPYVVKLYYSFQSSRRLYLVMEFVHGGDMLSLLQTCGALEEEYVRQYISEMVVALKYLHREGIIHRDIKPDNVLIDKNGHIKLTDFGLSHMGIVDAASTGAHYGGSPRSPLLSRDYDEDLSEMMLKSKVGTPDYMAPEILMGTGHDFTCDWWSLGVITFELLTAYPPYNDDSPDAIFDNILSTTVEYPDEVSPLAQSFISSLLVLDRRERLGARGAREVQAHAFFATANIDWAKLERGEFGEDEEPPFVPVLESRTDTSYFDETRLGKGKDEKESKKPLRRHHSLRWHQRLQRRASTDERVKHLSVA